MPCHLLLAKLAAAAPGPVLASLDKLVGPLEKTLTARLRGEPVKQEVTFGWGCILGRGGAAQVKPVVLDQWLSYSFVIACMNILSPWRWHCTASRTLETRHQ